MNDHLPALLVYGLGNPDRGDDGIGPYCAEAILARAKSLQLPWSIEGKSIFHLTIDELETAANYTHIFVIDASMDVTLADFTYRQVQPSACQQFTTHLLMPEEFLYNLIHLFGSRPTMQLISVRGYFWEMSSTLSLQAKSNADSAVAFFFSKLADWIG
ncbi:MAG: hydrogenase maturation protease [Bacteroidales bacterium]